MGLCCRLSASYFLKFSFYPRKVNRCKIEYRKGPSAVFRSYSHLLPQDEILASSNLETFAENNLNVTQNVKCIFHKVENIVGKKRKCWLPAFSPQFLTMFSKGLNFRRIKSRKRLNTILTLS